MSLLLFYQSGAAPAALDLTPEQSKRWIPSGGVYRQSYQVRTDYQLRLYAAPAAQTDYTLDGTGSQLTLTGGSAALDLALSATGSQLTLTGGTAYGDLSLGATGTQLTLTGGVAFGNLSLAATGTQATLSGGVAYGNITLLATGSALALSGGTAYGNLALAASGGALTLTGGTAGFVAGGDYTLDGTGSALALSGGTAYGDLSLAGTGAVLLFTGAEAGFTVEGVASTEEQPSGGYGWQNLAAIERRRRKRKKEEEELEEEADRLEALLIAEKALPPNPEVEARILVRDYADYVTSRRTQRAVDYALRAQTALAYELAARAIAKELEDEEHAVLLTLAML